MKNTENNFSPLQSDKSTEAKLFSLPKSKNEIEAIKTRLIEKRKYLSRYEINFSMSQNNIICCFDGKKLFLADINFNPIIVYESTSYINACVISATGKYVLCQMAYNKMNDEDSGATILFDVKCKRIIAKKPLPTGWKSVTHLFVDEEKLCIWVYYGEIKIKYDFNLETTQEDLECYKANIEKIKKAL